MNGARLNSFEELVALALHWSQLRTQIASIDTQAGSQTLKNLQRFAAEQTLARVEQNMLELLDRMQAVPSNLATLKPDVERMHKEMPYDNCVFLMTKFPENPGATLKDKQLDDITSFIEDALKPYGLLLRRGDRRNFATSSQLWDNVRIQMLGCRYGIAVLESKYADEFNPNVALEYGFMQALGRDVVLLIEESFKHRRADILATLGKNFKWSADAKEMRHSIVNAIDSWMVDLQKPRITT